MENTKPTEISVQSAVADSASPSVLGTSPKLKTYTPSERNWYLIGLAGQNVTYNVIGAALSYYLQFTLLIPAMAVSIIMALARVWDAFNDPMMGTIVDRTRSKWGKCRPYLMVIPIPIFIITVLCFVNFGFYGQGVVSDGLIVFWAALTYVLWGMIYTVGDIPLWGVTSLMTESEKEDLIGFRTRKLVKQHTGNRVLYWVLLIMTILVTASAVYSLVKCILGSGEMLETYINQIQMCVLAIVCLNIPVFFQKKLKVRIPDFIAVIVYCFIFIHFILGEIYRFYDHYILFDKVLHTTGGAIIAFIGFSVVLSFTNLESKKVKLSPFFIVLFSFCFALSIEYIWELVEYAVGGISLDHGVVRRNALFRGDELYYRVLADDTFRKVQPRLVAYLAFKLYGLVAALAVLVEQVLKSCVLSLIHI